MNTVEFLPEIWLEIRCFLFGENDFQYIEFLNKMKKAHIRDLYKMYNRMDVVGYEIKDKHYDCMLELFMDSLYLTQTFTERHINWISNRRGCMPSCGHIISSGKEYFWAFHRPNSNYTHKELYELVMKKFNNPKNYRERYFS